LLQTLQDLFFAAAPVWLRWRRRLLRFTIPVAPGAQQFPDPYIKVLGGKSLRSTERV